MIGGLIGLLDSGWVLVARFRSYDEALSALKADYPDGYIVTLIKDFEIGERVSYFGVNRQFEEYRENLVFNRKLGELAKR